MMRFRLSHATRKQLKKVRTRRENRFRNMSMGLIMLMLLASGTWVMLFQDQVRIIANWILDRPVSISLPDEPQTAEWKTNQRVFYEIDTAINGALLNLQATTDQVQGRYLRVLLGEAYQVPVIRRITVSTDYSLTDCNLEITRAIKRAGGAITQGVELRRSNELVLEISRDGKRTHTLYIARDPNMPRKMGRMAVIVMHTGRADESALRNLLDMDLPLTFALLPWVTGSKELAREITEREKEVIALLPLRFESFIRNTTYNRSEPFLPSEPVSRRAIRRTLRELPYIRGAMGFHVATEAATEAGIDLIVEGAAVRDRIDETEKEKFTLLKAIQDELQASGMYYVHKPALDESPKEKEDSGAGRQSFKVWGTLDPIQNPRVIAANLDLAALSSLDHESVVVAAEAHPHVLQALRNHLSQFALRGIEFVHVSDLLVN